MRRVDESEDAASKRSNFLDCGIQVAPTVDRRAPPLSISSHRADRMGKLSRKECTIVEFGVQDS